MSRILQILKHKNFKRYLFSMLEAVLYYDQFKKNSNFRLMANYHMFVPLQKFFRRKTARDLLPVKPVEIPKEVCF